ncbi:MAG: DNA repair protein RecN [Burkholderiaceae bacterium]|jgi:DNA repair protein RecN (Recombination protein N)|nr:DNA repair protein RecN [Burkholderiaceae bacterium]
MALKRIALRDFVIVQTLDLDLHNGFTALTGETGAGKSILIDALQLLLGARAETGVIREGAERTELAAEFDPPAHMQAWFEEAGIEQEDVLLIRRTIDVQGKSRAWINGSPVTATQLRALGEHLLDIHGQHAWQSLTRQDSVRGLLDAYAGVQAQPLAALWSEWREKLRALEHARAAQDTLQQERERLQWQIGELQKLSPRADEWDELNAQHAKLSNAQSLLDNAQEAALALEDEEGTGAISRLSHAQDLLQSYEHVDDAFRSMNEVLSNSLAQAEDVLRSLQGFLRHTELEPERLAELDTRLSQWISLARRYKRQPEDLPALLDGWKSELHALDSAADLDALAKAEAASRSAYEKAARVLSQKRTKAAPQLEGAVTQAMQNLGMAGGRFVVSVEPAAEPGSHGMDLVSFLVGSHPGMTPKPIGKVASGGELSRISLAISVTTSELGEAPTLIFDEVDSGVGGAVAETVGRLMQQLGKARQVLTVTHLPQVAACADHHLVVAKHKTARSTSSSVRAADGDERVQEIARMLGGEKLSAATLAHAREMLEPVPPLEPVRSAHGT